MRAQSLEKASSYEVFQEFATVLSLQKGQKIAVQFLRDLQNKTSGFDSEPMVKKALSMAKLFCRREKYHGNTDALMKASIHNR